MDEQAILQRINSARDKFGVTCAKYSGAVTVEVIREALLSHDIPVSNRDVFIKGIPIEFDLLIPRLNTICQDGILYAPKDVLAVLEIKTSGSFGEGTIKRVQECFDTVNKLDHDIFCAYVSFEERKTFKFKVTEENIPGKSYHLFWWNQKNGDDNYESTGDWQKLIGDLHSHLTKAIC